MWDSGGEMRTVVISSLLAEALPSGGELWWYCRGLDRDGCGRVVLDLAAVAAELKVSYGTICRWFNRCRDSEENGDRYLFRVLSRKHGQAIVMMRSLQKVKAAFSVEQIGGCGELALQQLKNIRYHATDLQVEFAQRQALYAAMASRGSSFEGKPTGKDLQAAEQALIAPVFERSQSLEWGAEKRSASITWIGDRCLFVKPDYLFSGVSQKSIGKSLDRVQRTVSRRLSAAARVKRGLPVVESRQIARQDLDQAFAIASLSPAETGVDTELAENTQRHFICSNRLWKSECNVYWLPTQLLQKRHWRKAARTDQEELSNP